MMIQTRIHILSKRDNEFLQNLFDLAGRMTINGNQAVVAISLALALARASLRIM